MQSRTKVGPHGDSSRYRLRSASKIGVRILCGTRNSIETAARNLQPGWHMNRSMVECAQPTASYACHKRQLSSWRIKDGKLK